MISFTWMKAKMAAVMAAFLAMAAFFLRLKYLEHQNEKMQHRANVLEARHHIDKVSKDIQRKKRKELSLQEKAIEKEKEKTPEEFSGYDNFSNPNDY